MKSWLDLPEEKKEKLIDDFDSKVKPVINIKSFLFLMSFINGTLLAMRMISQSEGFCSDGDCMNTTKIFAFLCLLFLIAGSINNKLLKQRDEKFKSWLKTKNILKWNEGSCSVLQNLLDGYINQEEILAYYNANITYKKLPKFIDGFVFNYKGVYNIIINSNLSYYRRKKTLIHELAHIELNHIGQVNKPLYAFQIQQKEDEADNYIKFLKEWKDMKWWTIMKI